MTPDRFIAAAFTQLAYEGTNWNLYVTAEFIHRVEQRAAELARESEGDGESVAWVAEVFPDWTTLQVIATGDAYAFNRETGRVYKVPDPNCPFLQYPNTTAWNTRASEFDGGEKAVVAVPRERLQEWLAAFSEEKAAYSDPIHHIETSIVQIREALNSSASRSVGGDWLPIESAPKDGTEILVYIPAARYSHGYVRSVQWRENDIDWWAVEDNKHGPFALRGGSPTHWQPLPAPPLAGVSEGKSR